MLTWTPRAVQDLEDIYAYIASDSQNAANRVLLHIRDTVGLLELHPLLGRPSRYTGRRELIVDQYVITYSTNRGSVRVLSFEHGARRK